MSIHDHRDLQQIENMYNVASVLHKHMYHQELPDTDTPDDLKWLLDHKSVIAFVESKWKSRRDRFLIISHVLYFVADLDEYKTHGAYTDYYIKLLCS